MVVEPTPTRTPLHEDRRRPVNHNLPHVGLGQQRLQRPVPYEVPESFLNSGLRIDDVERPSAGWRDAGLFGE
jgi:hypothetical protein